jgi:hypothetical protein
MCWGRLECHVLGSCWQMELQFEWLPDTVRARRKEVVELMRPIARKLRELEPSIASRQEGKQLMLAVEGRMAMLRAAALPITSPKLEEAGAQIRMPLQDEFYQSSMMVQDRRSLACAVAAYAAELAASTARKMLHFEAVAAAGGEGVGVGGTEPPLPPPAAVEPPTPGRPAVGKPPVQLQPSSPAKPPAGKGGTFGAKSAAAPEPPPKASPPKKKGAAVIHAEHVPGGAFSLQPRMMLARASATMMLTSPEGFVKLPITPEHVLSMCTRLGINLDQTFVLDDAEAEYWLIWIAVEALRAPLPPLWTVQPDGSFVHSVTREVCPEHPLLPVFAAQVRHERRRKRAARPHASLERFWLFATEAEGDEESTSFQFFNFATHQSISGRKLPAEAVAGMASRRPPPPPPPKTATRDTANSRIAATSAREMIEQRSQSISPAERARLAAEKAAKERPPPMSKEALAKLRSHCVGVRKASLALRPRSLPEILVAARMLHVDLVVQPQLVWLVDLALSCDYLPAAWEVVPPELMASLSTGREKQSDAMASVIKGMGDDEQLHAGGGGSAHHSAKTPVHPSRVEWLPPMERLWHLTARGGRPAQYAHQMCPAVTERHPLDVFIKSAIGTTPPWWERPSVD